MKNNIKRFDNFAIDHFDIKKPIMIKYKQPIIIKSRYNKFITIKIFFDENGKVNLIENDWNINIPNWIGLDISKIDILQWIINHRLLYIE